MIVEFVNGAGNCEVAEFPVGAQFKTDEFNNLCIYRNQLCIQAYQANRWVRVELDDG